MPYEDWDEGEDLDDEDESIFQMDEQDERDMQDYQRALDEGSDQEQPGGRPADDETEIPF